MGSFLCRCIWHMCKHYMVEVAGLLVYFFLQSLSPWWAEHTSRLMTNMDGLDLKQSSGAKLMLIWQMIALQEIPVIFKHVFFFYVFISGGLKKLGKVIVKWLRRVELLQSNNCQKHYRQELNHVDYQRRPRELHWSYVLNR